MTWVSGSKLFVEMWPLIHTNIPNDDHRIKFTGSLLKLMIESDMNPYDVEYIHPDIGAAMRAAGIVVNDPVQCTDQPANKKAKKN